MYKEKELFEKVDGHVKRMKLLKVLVEDIDEFNKKYSTGNVEMYIDFDNVGDYSEFDPYETFSIRLHDKNSGKTANVHDHLSIEQLDDCLCAIECYHEELEELKN